ncbi:YbjN domain-containing protein [Allostreptomyces psammosilenae]|uniref:YbjN domain-containing protein n=1 Tax=Allostreptomyces psammosilenae TaxID=1892865 RepID=A0A853AB09_9ACTN|nr:YbjN domain-containing protein [Allostreptomyces psammosilenae]NYI07552.1 hypothetical protein [Allostreptomyces psammosilenae]
MTDSERRHAARVLAQALDEAGVEWEEEPPGTYVATLPGVQRLKTTCSLVLGRHSLSINAFVMRRPDENADAVHRWMLERNTRLYGVAFALDRLGDVYLVGRLPLSAVTPREVDRLLGSVLETADGSFNRLLEMGFATAIRKEWKWRAEHGESLDNLAAFAHLTRRPEAPERPDDPGAARPGGIDRDRDEPRRGLD